ncbi:hypothetical protein P5V15_004639 [Pogonomyrmex californicus]
MLADQGYDVGWVIPVEIRIQKRTFFFSPSKKVLELLIDKNPLVQFLTGLFCDETFIQRKLCSNVAFLIFGFDNEQFNTSLILIILEHYPADSSNKTLVHYAQEVSGGRFSKYDYGREKNLEYYSNTSEPPSYKLKNISAPFALFYAKNDYLSDVEVN